MLPVMSISITEKAVLRMALDFADFAKEIDCDRGENFLDRNLAKAPLSRVKPWHCRGLASPIKEVASRKALYFENKSNIGAASTSIGFESLDLSFRTGFTVAATIAVEMLENRQKNTIAQNNSSIINFTLLIGKGMYTLSFGTGDENDPLTFSLPKCAQKSLEIKRDTWYTFIMNGYTKNGTSHLEIDIYENNDKISSEKPDMGQLEVDNEELPPLKDIYLRDLYLGRGPTIHNDPKTGIAINKILIYEGLVTEGSMDELVTYLEKGGEVEQRGEDVPQIL